MTKYPDRRREPRVGTRNLVNVTEHDAEGNVTTIATGRTLDLSHAGARVELDEPFAVGSRLGLRMALGQRLVDAEGEVRYVDEARSAYTLGLRISGLSTPGYEAVHEHLVLHSP